MPFTQESIISSGISSGYSSDNNSGIMSPLRFTPEEEERTGYSSGYSSDNSGIMSPLSNSFQSPQPSKGKPPSMTANKDSGLGLKENDLIDNDLINKGKNAITNFVNIFDEPIPPLPETQELKQLPLPVICDYILDNFNNLLDLLFSLITESNREYLQFSLVCDHFNYICEYSCDYYKYDKDEQKGGSSFCEGTLDSYPQQLAYSTLGCAKLLPELTHDFHPYFTKTIMEKFKYEYTLFINLIKNNNNHGNESDIVSKFVDSLLANNHEWNYSTKVLEFMDNECN